MTRIEETTAEVVRRKENVHRYRAILEEGDKPRLTEARRNLEEAKRLFHEAEKAVELGESMLRIEEMKLVHAYKEFYDAANE